MKTIDIKKIVRIIEKNNLTDTKLNSLIGAEIRLARKNRHLTFKQTCYEICCESYLNKLELRGEMPQQRIFLQLCERVGLENEKLTSLDKMLAETVEAFYYKESKVLEKNFALVEKQSNHRAKLIKIAYYVFNDMYKDAYELEKQMDNVVDSMCNMDIDYYLLFEGIIAYKNQLYKEAIELFKIMIIDTHVPNSVFLLRDRYLLLALLASGDVEFLYELQKYKEKLMECKSYNELEYLDYMECFFLLFSNSRVEYENKVKLLKNKKYLNSLKLIDCAIFQNFNAFDEIDKKKLNLFCMYLTRVLTREKNISLEISRLDQEALSFDFSISILEYLLLNNDEDKMTYVKNLISTKNPELRNKFVFIYFEKEVMRLAYKTTKYKLVYDFYCLK